MLTFLSEAPVNSKCFAVARHQVRRLIGLRQKTTQLGIKSGRFGISLRNKRFRASSSSDSQ